MRILLVDDDEIQIESLKIGLTSRGYEVQGTSNVREALDFISEGGFDILITDYYMPQSSGLDLLKQLRQNSLALPVIMMTGYADKKLVTDAKHHYCDAFIEKPFTLDTLVKTIQKVSKKIPKKNSLIHARESVCKSPFDEAVNRPNDILDTLIHLLGISFENHSQEKLLDKVIKHVLDIPWFSEKGQGGLFLVDKESNCLKPEIKDYFPEPIQKTCNKLPFGESLCGRSATKKKVQYCTHDHINKYCKYSEKFFWNIYSVPIVNGNQILGILVVILSPDHEESSLEKKFLTLVSSIIAGIILRKSAEKERERIEALLRHSQKMQAIGSLTGSIAHDFNNLIQVILGFSQLLLLNVPQENPQYEKIREIESAAQKARNLTRQLLTFSRKTNTEYTLVDLNVHIRRTAKFLERLLPKTIKIDLSLSKALKPVYVDPDQIEQAVVNLCLNARDAMPTGGTIRIETRKVFLDELFCKAQALRCPGEHVFLSVTDTGEGMDKHLMEHIYEPFFTTKEKGGGTGLGLPIVRGIVKNHGGQIICESKPGIGTTFKIYVPANRKTVARSEPIQCSSNMEGNETILLIDDEEAMLKITKSVLNTFGYKTFTALNGSEALTIFSKQRNAIDLVILDLIMPGMDGIACLNRLLEINPEAKVLVTSGYTMEESIRTILDRGARGILRKPFEIEQMLRAIRSVLD
ncbi:MAG TPA: response regulator [Deltaproteobacteria bacterium]|nr:response regulator [Deltaproteobacteria bacterium]